MGREEFLSRCGEVREAVKNFKKPVIVNHYDADGLSSGALVVKAMKEMGKGYEVKTVKKVDEELVKELKGKEVVFVDLGGSTPIVDELEDVVVIDHHQTKGGSALQANPHLFGLDGGTEISASGVAYCVFKTGVDLAIVGAIGDMQYPLVGMNGWIVEEGTKEGAVRKEVDLRLFGRVSRPLISMLLYADDPFLPGLTGNEGACASFLDGAGIELKDNEGKWKVYYDLSEEERRKLIGELARYLTERGLGGITEGLVGEVYLLLKREKGTELYDASEFSTLLNACGRNWKPEIGIGVCLGDEGAFREAKNLLAEHRRNLRNGIEFAGRKTEDYGGFLFLDGRGVIRDTIIGVIAGMLYWREKPIIGIADDEKGGIKVSGRGKKELVEKGLNLGKVLGESSRAVGGDGGGHKIAAGANIPRNRLNDFLKEVGKRL